ncbi:hypothetical protein LOTGIDRAFT_172807 [Lottia gigantea]|uniref:SEA domain-containing protein n=1 Tax=Lottia gigantea TaxID=225164 RepID=V4AAP4_LOTGI|nr:hypothetical protein LOTGIDRAFT_172807 [Lottia gigantea]ESP01074.1 hypothetical protein LOTGIDRAFT_172807 [Lottia gigantea]
MNSKIICALLYCFVSFSQQVHPYPNSTDPNTGPSYAATKNENKPLIEPMSFPMEQSSSGGAGIVHPLDNQGSPVAQLSTNQETGSNGPRRYFIERPVALQLEQNQRPDQITRLLSGRNRMPTRFRANSRGNQQMRQNVQYQTVEPNPRRIRQRNGGRPLENRQFQDIRLRQQRPAGNQIRGQRNPGQSSFPLPADQIDPKPTRFASSPTELNHPEYDTKYYLIEILMDRPSSAADHTVETLQSIFTIFRSMSINDLVAENAYKIVGRPCVIFIVKGKKGSQDIASSIERVTRSLERLGTKVETKLLYSLEAFVESTATRFMPLSNLVRSTRAPVPQLSTNNLYLCRMTFDGTGMDKIEYLSQTLNSTLEMLERRAEGQVRFKGHKIAGGLPFEFQYIGNFSPDGNEMAVIDAIPILHAGNAKVITEEVQTLDELIQIMKNTQAVNIARV